MATLKLRVRASAETKLIGNLSPPPDKSITIRALLLAMLAEGTSTIENPLSCGDTEVVLAAVRALGAKVEESESESGRNLRITGGKLTSPAAPLDLRNSGTGLRLLAGICAGCEGLEVTLTGDESLRRRPMRRVVEPLTRMGADIAYLESEGCAPLRIRGKKLAGIRYELPIPSAQMKSALLLAGLLARGTTEVVERAPSRDHTERMLPWFGVEVAEDAGGGRRVIGVEGGARLKAITVRIPRDFSSAFLPIALSLCLPGSSLRTEGGGLNPTRLGAVRVLGDAGAKLQVEQTGEWNGEPVGCIFASHSQLSRIEVTPSEVPTMIDELSLLALVASQARDGGVIRGAGELRVKESDRLETTMKMLGAFGADCEIADGELRISGGQKLAPARVDSAGDHRMAMLGLACSLLAGGESEIAGWECADVSWQGLADDLKPLLAGAELEVVSGE